MFIKRKLENKEKNEKIEENLKIEENEENEEYEENDLYILIENSINKIIYYRQAKKLFNE